LTTLWYSSGRRSRKCAFDRRNSAALPSRSRSLPKARSRGTVLNLLSHRRFDDTTKEDITLKEVPRRRAKRKKAMRSVIEHGSVVFCGFEALSVLRQQKIRVEPQSSLRVIMGPIWKVPVSLLRVSTESKSLGIQDGGSPDATIDPIPDLSNSDLSVHTSAKEGPTKLPHAWAVTPGTASVAIRYRFITTEFPDWSGSRCNDFFSVMIRSKSLGTFVEEANNMNSLGYDLMPLRRSPTNLLCCWSELHGWVGSRFDPAKNARSADNWKMMSHIIIKISTHWLTRHFQFKF